MTNLKASELQKIILLDHDDSFTMNIKMWLSPLFEVDVIHHLDFNRAQLARYDGLVLSPGPKAPVDYPQTLNIIRQIPDQFPLFGICLGLQMLCFVEGAQIQPYTPPLHGKTSCLESRFSEFHQTQVARYHSLYIHPIPECYEQWASSEGLPMWLTHRSKKRMGFQFHPESFLTQKQDQFLIALKNWMSS